MADEYDQHQIENDFRQACSLGNLADVKKAIEEQKVGVDVADKYEQFTGLHMACEGNAHPKVIEYLLGHNAAVNCQNSLGETPLVIFLKPDKKHKVDQSLTNEARNRIVDMLLSHGADVDLGYSKDVESDSKAMPKAIHCAIIIGDIGAIRLLIASKPALIESVDKLGRLPIHYAAKYGNVFAMQELLSLGAKLEAVDNEGYTPFHTACDYSQLDAVQFILDQGGRMHSKTKKGDQGIHIASRHKVKEIVPIVEFLINQGADQHAKDSEGKCLKDYIKENILLRNVVSSAKSKASKYANDSRGQSFAILDLKGKELLSQSGFKVDDSGSKLKRVEGKVTVFEYGLLYSFKKGWVSKTVVEEFHPWQPEVELVADAENPKLLRVNFSRGNMDDEKQADHGVDRFGILPCRPAEVMETIQKEINTMFPTYSLQIEVREFITKIGDDAGVGSMIEEYEELKINVETAENEANGLKIKMDEGSVDESEQNRYNQLQSERNTMRSRMSEIEASAKSTWSECEQIINGRIEPLIGDLCGKIDSMTAQNEHWKLISNVRKSLEFAKEHKKKLINIRTQIRSVAMQNGGDNFDGTASYPTV